MHTKITRIGFLLAICFGLFMALPTKAASLQQVTNWVPSGVPTNVSMYAYVPDNVVSNPPVLVLLHYWGGTAASVFAQAAGGGIVAAADQYGFIMVVPQRSNDCWDYGSTQSLTHDGGGETHAIAQMVRYAITNYHANADRVYVTGDSCGGMMTEAMLAVYPDMFKAGVAFAGVPVGGQWAPVTHTAQQWGNLVRACYPGYSGPRPRVQLWHGTADSLVNYSNLLEAAMQWGNVLGLNTNPTISNTVPVVGVTNQWIHQAWKDTNGATLLDTWADIGGDHGPSDALFKARYLIPFLGLDQVGPVDPKAYGQRGRPHLNAARTTFVADNGQPLRGPYTSTEWTSATTYDQIAKMKDLGFNAVHLYGESFDKSYPTNGSTAPGYATSRIDSIVQSTRDLGLYLVITIGNGAWNGDYNRAYITNFWNLYAARYANETHVLFEIQNEPVAWGPPYSAANATPPGALDMEIAAYNTIRAKAPNSPVLLFTYAVLGGTGGSDAALTDIHAFNQTVFGTQNAVWTNMAVGFHGYAGASSAAVAVANLISAGYPCLMTEFGDGTWGGGYGGLDVEGVANWERLGVSWLGFQYIPPTGVSDDVTKPEVYLNRVVNAGLSWTPDYGNFPASRGVYGNGGYPWTTSGYVNNSLSGTLRIEAENFDNGGKNVAYYNANSSNPGGQYRTGETVGIESTSDTGGGYDVGWNAAGDWLEYTMKISVAGTYNLRLRVAGTSAGSMQVLAYNNNRNQITNGVDLTGPWTLPNTGGNQTWQTVTKSVFLAPGQQRLRINVLAAGFNLNWMELTPATSGPIANGTYKFVNAASAQALDLDANNVVIAATPSSSTKQQWNLRHIGGGNYQVSPASGGNSWDAGTPLHLSPWGWGASGSSCFFMQPTVGGFYRFFSAGGGTSFAVSSATNVLNDGIYTGAAAQQWAIVAPATPVFPTGLSVTAIAANQNGLTWNAVAGATSYNVKRSLTSGGSYTTIATGVTGTNYTDTVAVGTIYYYVVSAVVSGVEGINSLEATVALPFPWMTQDVGSVGAAGGVAYTYSNGVFSVAGSGSDIWGSADAFRFVYVPVTGNCTVVVRVVSVQNVDGWSKAGVMIRESMAANAANAFIAVTPGNGVTWQTRSSTGANTGNSATSGLSAPYWVKLVRSGNTFTGYRSTDGTNWTQQGTATFTMASTAYIGLAVTSHNNSSLCTAVFDNMTAPNWPPPTAPTGLSATLASSSQINLTWNAFAGATSYNLKRATTSGGPYTVVATGVTSTSFADVGLVAGVKYYYVVSAMAGGTESPDSAEASAIGQWAWLKFDEGAGTSAADSSGHGRNGTLVNGPAWVAGKFGNAVDLNSTNQYVSLPTGVVNGLSNCTIAVWVNLDAASTWSRVFDFGSGTSTNMFLTVNNGSVVRFALKAGDGGGEQTIDGLSPLPTSVWTHVAVTLNGSTGILYVNGVEAGRNSSLTLTPSSMGGTTQNYLGKSQYGDPYLDGRVDDFRVCSEALGAADVAALAAQQAVAAPVAPVGLAATSVPGEVNLVWNTVTNAISYNLKYSATNGGSYTVIATGITATNYHHAGLNPGTNYYMVSAVNLGGESSYSAPVSVTTLPAAPAVPTGLMATAVSTLQINLSWTASAGAGSYNVKRSSTNGGTYTIVASGITATNYTDSGLTGGTMYYYVVSAVNSGGESTNSVPAAAATLSPTQGSMVHRYSFSESGGSTVADSVGGPVWAGTLPNGGTLAGGQLALSGSLQYASLPSGVVSSLTNVTVMAWVNLSSVSYWSRIFDFGNDTTSYMFLTPRNGFDYTARFAISTGGAGTEQKVNAPLAVGIDEWHQVAVTLNQGTGVLYVDGVAVGTNANLTVNPASLGSTTHNYLGRSQSGSEPYLSGVLDEFRIYNVALPSSEIAAMAALGPDQLLSTNSPAMSIASSDANLTMSWPVECAGYTLQSRTNLTLGNWVDVTVPAPHIVGSQWQVTLPPSAAAGQVFYRLVK